MLSGSFTSPRTFLLLCKQMVAMVVDKEKNQLKARVEELEKDKIEKEKEIYSLKAN